MEEKERFELKIYAGCEYYSITDTKEKQQITIENTINLLNQQDKRIKELEETNKVLSNELTKNSILKQDHIETCCGIPIFEIPKIKEENQQLKSQPKEIVEKIRNICCVEDKCEDGSFILGINEKDLDTILKEYQK